MSEARGGEKLSWAGCNDVLLQRRIQIQRRALLHLCITHTASSSDITYASCPAKNGPGGQAAYVGDPAGFDSVNHSARTDKSHDKLMGGANLSQARTSRHEETGD